MAGQEYSRYQRGIIRRGYEHKDTIALQRLGEIVSDLYLAEGSQRTRLWNNARAALMKLVGPKGDDPRIAKVLASRDPQQLAQLLNQLNKEAQQSSAAARGSDDEPVIGEGALSQSTAARPDAKPASGSEPATQPTPPGPSPAHAGPLSEEPTAEQLKSAMKMFRKRVKLKKLDDESKLGRSPLSSGKTSAHFAIMAPREYPPAVWEELARQGKLRHAGGSFYELVEGM